MLGVFHLTDYPKNRNYILDTQDTLSGGFSKWPASTTDPFHTYFGLCGLSFLKEPGLAEVMPSLNITMKSFHKLLKLQKQWKTECADLLA